MIKEIVQQAIKAVNQELDNPLLNNADDNTLLFDNLDSMAMLDLILEIEDKLQSI